MPQLPKYATAEQLGFLLGVTRQQVGNYVKKGMPKQARGRYELATCIQWVIEGLKEKRDDKEDHSDLALERLRLYQAQRIKTELENSQTRGELLRAEEVADVFNAMAAEAATQLDAIGGRLASELAGLNNPAEIQARLLREARAIRANIARGWDAIANNTDGRVDTDAAA